MQLSSSSFPLLKRQTIEIALGIALLAICSHITIPLKGGPIPVTLQTVAVMFIGLIKVVKPKAKYTT